MKNVRLETLLPEHFTPYINRPTFVRIMTSGTPIFVGRLDTTGWEDHSKSLCLNNGHCEIIVNPLATIRDQLTVPVDPNDPGAVLCRWEWIRGRCEIGQELRPFKLSRPRRIVWESLKADCLLGIDSPDGHTAIISRRPADLEEVEKILRNVHVHI